MSDSEQGKSEQATPFKLQRARQKGTVARSTDLGFLVGLAAFLAYLWMAGEAFVARVAQSARGTFAIAPGIVAEPATLFALTADMFAAVARPVAMMAGAIFLVVLLFELLQTGFVFSAQPLKPDFSRINPGKGFKRIFSWQMLINAAKNVLKMVAYSTVAFLAIRSAFRETGPTILDGRSLGTAIAHAGFHLLLYFLALAACFAVFDQFLVRRSFGKQMRMSRREVRREARDREGEPRMKQRRKKLHAEFIKNSKGLRNMRSADLLVVNPVHYAVALRYDSAKMAAPMVVAQGAHEFALRLKRIAFLYGVTIVEDPPLARDLYRTCVVEREIPEVHYGRVARIYLDLRQKKKIQEGGS
jgi:flagellar biosynthetic protein FlhB